MPISIQKTLWFSWDSFFEIVSNDDFGSTFCGNVCGTTFDRFLFRFKYIMILAVLYTFGLYWPLNLAKKGLEISWL